MSVNGISGALQMVNADTQNICSGLQFAVSLIPRSRSPLSPRDLCVSFNSSERKGLLFRQYVCYDGGARSFISNKPITKPERFSGASPRVRPPLKRHCRWKALGGALPRMAQGELLPHCAWWRRSIPLSMLIWCHAEVAKTAMRTHTVRLDALTRWITWW